MKRRVVMGQGAKGMSHLAALLPHGSSPSSGFWGEMGGLGIFPSGAAGPLVMHQGSPLPFFSPFFGSCS